MIDDELQADFDFFGIEPGAPPAPAPFALWDESWPAMRLFMAATTQWRRTVAVGLGGGVVIWDGLDYQGVLAAARFLEIEPGPSLFGDLQVLEAEAIHRLNHKRGR